MMIERKRGPRKLVLYENHGVKITVKVGRHIKNYAITIGKEFLKDFMESRYREEKTRKSRSIKKGFLNMSMCKLYSINSLPGHFTRNVANLTRNVIYDVHGYITLKSKIARRRVKSKARSIYKAKIKKKRSKNLN